MTGWSCAGSPTYWLTNFRVDPLFLLTALVWRWCSTDLLVVGLLLHTSLFDGRTAELCTKICHFNRSIGLRLLRNERGGAWEAYAYRTGKWCLRIWYLSGRRLLGSQEYVSGRVEATCSLRYYALDMVGATETWGSPWTTYLYVSHVQDSRETWGPIHNRTQYQFCGRHVAILQSEYSNCSLD